MSPMCSRSNVLHADVFFCVATHRAGSGYASAPHTAWYAHKRIKPPQLCFLTFVFLDSAQQGGMKDLFSLKRQAWSSKSPFTCDCCAKSPTLVTRHIDCESLSLIS